MKFRKPVRAVAKQQSVLEYRTITVPRDFPRSAVKSMLVEEAEMNHWTLDKVQIRHDGKRIITLRRRIIRAIRIDFG